jgi:signal transduction histidine kinase
LTLGSKAGCFFPDWRAPRCTPYIGCRLWARYQATSISETLEPGRLRALIDVGVFIVSELDLDAVLGHVLESARELTGARYAALAVLNADRSELERFITRGIDEETARTIGEPPRGRGVLGELIAHPEPLRAPRIGDHPASYGFPAGHPPMDSFLGVPVFIRGQVWGNLYLAEKRGGAFDGADEDAIVALARWAAIAVENARLYQDADDRRGELERALHGLQATQAVALAVGTETELERVLELIVKRGRALVEARCLVIMLLDGDELVLAAGAGERRTSEGLRIPVRGSTEGEVLQRGRPERIDDVTGRLRVAADRFGVDGARTAVIVPLTHRGEALGTLVAFDRGPHGEPFSDDDEQLLKAFAASAATAVATAQGVEQQRLRDSLQAAEAERRRWARELHDETLQSLAGLRVLLASARRTGDGNKLAAAVDAAIEQLEEEITNLRAIITELRPAALDELGLVAALDALFDRHRAINDLAIADELAVPENSDGTSALDAEIQASVYRIVQEALTNVAKHAGASGVRVVVRADGARLLIEVSDDGSGFEPSAPGGGGFGLRGIRERIAAAGGELTIESSPAGTTVTARLPLSLRRGLSYALPRAAAGHLGEGIGG